MGIARVENNDEIRRSSGLPFAREAVGYLGYFLRKNSVDENWIYKHPGPIQHIGCQTSESDVLVLR